jgi:hypothetical protein
MYRDWELIDVLATQAAAWDDSEELAAALREARSHVMRRNDQASLDFLERRLRLLLAALPEDAAAQLIPILDDLVAAIRNGIR